MNDTEGRRCVIRKSRTKKRFCPSVLSLYVLLDLLKGLLASHPSTKPLKRKERAEPCATAYRLPAKMAASEVTSSRHDRKQNVGMEASFSPSWFQHHHRQGSLGTSLNLPSLNICFLPVLYPSSQFWYKEEGPQITKNNRFFCILNVYPLAPQFIISHNYTID